MESYMYLGILCTATERRFQVRSQYPRVCDNFGSDTASVS